LLVENGKQLAIGNLLVAIRVMLLASEISKGRIGGLSGVTLRMFAAGISSSASPRKKSSSVRSQLLLRVAFFFASISFAC